MIWYIVDTVNSPTLDDKAERCLDTGNTGVCRVALQGARVLLIEPRGTPNTGDRETAAPRVVI
jgi:hypothetical protein